MAKKTPPPTVEEDTPETRKKAGDQKLLTELRDRYKKCVAHDSENRAKYKANMKFTLVPGEQWDEASKKDRGKDRVMYEFNEVRIKCKAVINQIRSNRPSAKITPAEDGDVELAEAMKGLIDQIQNASDADSVMDYATQHQVIGGMGAERYITQWQEDSADQQDIVIEPVKNPMCLYADYACQKQDKSDARFWFYAAKLANDVYKAKYPNAKPVEFEVEDEFDDDCDDEHTWVCEYWKQEPVTRVLQLLSNGKTVEAGSYKALPPGVTVVKDRKAQGWKIVQYICSGNAILEGPNEWAGRYFPFNIAYGEYAVIDGKEVWYGLPEHGKDAQRAHNWAMTSVFETIASTPQGTTWVTAEQAKGLLPEWAEAQRKNIRIKRYNHDAKAPGPPVSEPAAAVPTALVMSAQMSSDGLKSVLGMPDATLGETGAENSGVAIRRRQEAGAVANYNFGDNMTKFARRRTEILIDLIPKVQDTERTVRVLGKDGAEKWIKINQFDPVTGQTLNDLSAPKFDLVVTQGPNFATQRQEAAETYATMQQTNPTLALAAGDLVMKAMDLPYAQEIAERLRAMLPPQVQAVIDKNKPQDPSVVAAMQQVQELQANLQEQAAMIDEEQAKAVTDKAAAEKAKSDVVVASAQLSVQEAQLATMQANLATQVANFKQLVAETHANFAQADSAEIEAKAAEKEETTALDRDESVGILAEGLQAMQQETAQMLEQLAQLVVQPKPKEPLTATSERVNGEIVTSLSDGRKAVSKKVNGKMVTTMDAGVQ